MFRRLACLIPLIALMALVSSCGLDKEAISDFRDKHETERLTKRLGSKDPDVRIDAILQLKDKYLYKYDNFIPYFQTIAESDQDPIVRATAIEGLGSRNVGSIFFRTVRDENPLIRGATIPGLVEIACSTGGTESYIDIVINAIDDPDMDVVKKAMAGVISYTNSSNGENLEKEEERYQLLLKQVPVLKSYLKNDDVDIRALAAVLLARIGVNQDGVIPALIEGVQHGDYRFEVINSLDEIPIDWSPAVPYLLDLIKSGPSSDEVGMSVDKLGAGKTSLETLRKQIPGSYLLSFLESKTPTRIDLISTNMDQPDLIEKLRFYRDGYPPEEISTDSYDEYQLKLRAIYALSNTGPTSEINETLKTAATDDDPLTRAWAYGSIGRIGNKVPENLEVLLKGLHDRDSDALLFAISAIGSYGPEAAKGAMPYLISLLKDEASTDDEMVMALRAIEGIGPAADEVVPLLIEMLKGNDPGAVKIEITHALISIWSALDTPPEEYKQILMGQDEWAKRIALGALPAYGPNAIPMLLNVFTQSSPDDMGRIAGTLVEIIRKAPESIGDVLPYLHNQDESVREYTIKLLTNLGPLATDAIPDLKSLAENDESQHIRELAAQAITEIEEKSQSGG